jgi:hypothetical protein
MLSGTRSLQRQSLRNKFPTTGAISWCRTRDSLLRRRHCCRIAECSTQLCNCITPTKFRSPGRTLLLRAKVSSCFVRCDLTPGLSCRDLGGASGVGGKACASERFHTRIRAKPKRVGNNIAIEEGSGVAMFGVTVKFPTSAMLLSAFVVPYTLDVKQLKQPEGPQVHVVFTIPHID